jgi:hypothetical protein
MALSDTCFEALDDLQNDLVGYADWGYNPKELNRIVTAMFELGSFIVIQDIPPGSSLDKLDDAIDRVVVGNLLEKAHTQKCEIICSILAEIAKMNVRLNQGIESMIDDLTSEPRLFEVIKAPHVLSQLQEIKKLIEIKTD